MAKRVGKYRVRQRQQPPVDWDRVFLEERQHESKSLAQIAREQNVTWPAVFKALERRGLVEREDGAASATQA